MSGEPLKQFERRLCKMRNKWGKFGLLVLATVFILFATVCNGAAQQPPIKAGVLLALTGPHAMIGKTTLEGIEAGFEKWNKKVAGRAIEVIVEDDEGKPEVALTKTKKLVERDKVQVIFGPVSSASAYAIKEYLREAKVPLMMVCAGAGGLTRENMSPYFFRVWHGTGMYDAANWGYQKLGVRKAIFSGVDYAYGREIGEAFSRGFTKAGGTMVGEVFAALGTKDYGPYVTKIAKMADDTGADTLGFIYSGADVVSFLQQVQEYGLNKKFKYIVNYAGTLVGRILTQIGSAAEGIYEVCPYSRYTDNAENKTFIKLMEKKGGPGYMEGMAAPGYLGVDVVCRAIEANKGNVEDKASFLQAIRNVRYESSFGPFEFDPRDQNLKIHYKMLQCKTVNGKMDQVIVDTIPNTVDWTWLEKK
jgi:branched-chain amino acid transport system substrate-binding protein